MIAGDLQLCACFAGLEAVVPRVLQVCVARTSTSSEPRTSTTATTALAGFPDDSTFGTYDTDGRPRTCWCLDM